MIDGQSRFPRELEGFSTLIRCHPFRDISWTFANGRDKSQNGNSSTLCKTSYSSWRQPRQHHSEIEKPFNWHDMSLRLFISLSRKTGTSKHSGGSNGSLRRTEASSSSYAARHVRDLHFDGLPTVEYDVSDHRIWLSATCADPWRRRSCFLLVFGPSICTRNGIPTMDLTLVLAMTLHSDQERHLVIDGRPLALPPASVASPTRISRPLSVLLAELNVNDSVRRPALLKLVRSIELTRFTDTERACKKLDSLIFYHEWFQPLYDQEGHWVPDVHKGYMTINVESCPVQPNGESRSLSSGGSLRLSCVRHRANVLLSVRCTICDKPPSHPLLGLFPNSLVIYDRNGEIDRVALHATAPLRYGVCHVSCSSLALPGPGI